MTSNSKALRRISLLEVFFTAAVILTLGAAMLLLPAAAANGAKKGLVYCSEILIPSLFPFMVLSAFVVKSGLAARLGKLLEPITRFLFRLPGCTGATIFISMIGGYPAGARGVKALIERGEITLKQGERMLCFTVGAGPAFVISVVGAGLLGSGRAGIILFVSQSAASLALGILAGIFSRGREESLYRTPKKFGQKQDLSSALVDSSSDSAKGMMNMCAFVVLFSSLICLIQESSIGEMLTRLLVGLGVSERAAGALLPILLEVTGGCANAAEAGASPQLISFALGWAGACVHFQISSSLTGIRFSRLRFTLFRFLHGLLAAFLSYFGFLLFSETSEVFSTVSEPLHYSFASSPAGSIALLFTCALFLFSLCFQGMDFRAKKC